jgi:ribosomal protein L16/L10AE
MVVNFRVRGISRGARKLARTLTLNYIKKKKKLLWLRVVPNLSIHQNLNYVIQTPIFEFDMILSLVCQLR